MVNNPPGFAHQTGLPSIVIPHGDSNDLLRAVQQSCVRQLILDANRPWQLATLFDQTDIIPQLKLRQLFGSVQLDKINSP